MAIVFNGVTRQIEVTDPSIIQLDAGKELYSEWKRWQQLDPANGGYAPAFRTFGGDPTATGQNAPKYFFLQNYWRVFINNGNIVSVALNLYSDDFVSPYIVAAGSGVSDRNSDAVSVNSADIQFASYNGGVTIDIANITGNATDGTQHPVGTARKPVNNLDDLLVILQVVGLGDIFVVGDLTIPSPYDFSGYHFYGDSPLKTTIDINSGATIDGAEFQDSTITGTFGIEHTVKDCILDTVLDIGGLLIGCGLTNTVQVQAGILTEIWEAKSRVPGTLTPIMDMNGTGILSFRDYEGGMKFINYSGSSAHTISLAEGQVILDSATITGGVWVVRGIGKLIDENGTPIESGTWNGTVTIINELLTAGSIGGGSNVWSEEEKEESLAYVKKSSDNAEQANLKL